MEAAKVKELSRSDVVTRREEVIDEMYEALLLVEKRMSNITFTLCKAEFSSFVSRFKLHYVPTDEESIEVITNHFINIGYGVEEIDQHNDRQSVCINVDWSEN